MHTFFPETYPLADETQYDFDKDGSITDQDAIYLLMNTFFPELYPIASPVPPESGKPEKEPNETAAIYRAKKSGQD